MRALLFESVGNPLRVADLSLPKPSPHHIRIKVTACGVCRTDLHIVDGELAVPRLPLVPGHQIVGTVDKAGEGVNRFAPGERVGVPWLGETCGVCGYCTAGKENLCDDARFTGFHIDGGFAEYAVAHERFCFLIPGGYPDLQAAPLLCAGLIGYRSYAMCGEARRIGFYGFGAAAHILIQVARYQEREVYAFTRPHDTRGQEFARSLGAVWAGDTSAAPPKKLDTAIIFAPAGECIPAALRAVRKGGVVVCAGIHMSDIPSFPYAILWEERCVRSVANLTRKDGEEFLAIAPKVPVRTEVTTFALEQANEALEALRSGTVNGAVVLEL